LTPITKLDQSSLVKNFGIPNAKNVFLNEKSFKGQNKSEIEDSIRFYMGKNLIDVDDQFLIYSPE